MNDSIGKQILFLSSLLSLLFVGKLSFALTAQEKIELWDRCIDQQCNATDCIRVGPSDISDYTEFCFCTDCEDYSTSSGEEAGDSDKTAGTLYQVGKEQYFCGAIPKGSRVPPKCVPFPVQIKTVDLNETRIESTDKSAIDEIRRLKGMNSNKQIQTTTTKQVTSPFQSTTKTTSPVFRKTAPTGRQD